MDADEDSLGSDSAQNVAFQVHNALEDNSSNDGEEDDQHTVHRINDLDHQENRSASDQMTDEGELSDNDDEVKQQQSVATSENDNINEKDAHHSVDDDGSSPVINNLIDIDMDDTNNDLNYDESADENSDQMQHTPLGNQSSVDAEAELLEQMTAVSGSNESEDVCDDGKHSGDEDIENVGGLSGIPEHDKISTTTSVSPDDGLPDTVKKEVEIQGNGQSISNSEDGQLSDQDSGNSSERMNVPAVKEIDAERKTCEDGEFDELEEGEIQSDSDDAIPEIKGGISPKYMEVPVEIRPLPSVRLTQPLQLQRVRASERSEKDGVCKFYMRGNCNWGENCKYYHPREPDRSRLVQKQRLLAQQRQMPSLVQINPNSMALTNNPVVLLPGGRLPIFPPALGPPVPLLSVSAAPPLPPTKEETIAWERGLRQARELVKKSQGQFRQPEDYAVHNSFNGQRTGASNAGTEAKWETPFPEMMTQFSNARPNSTSFDDGNEFVGVGDSSKSLKQRTISTSSSSSSSARAPARATFSSGAPFSDPWARSSSNNTVKKGDIVAMGTVADQSQHSSRTNSPVIAMDLLPQSPVVIENRRYKTPPGSPPPTRDQSRSRSGSRRLQHREQRRRSTTSSSRPTIPDDENDFDGSERGERRKMVKANRRQPRAEKDKGQRRGGGRSTSSSSSSSSSSSASSRSSTSSSQKVKKAGSNRKSFSPRERRAREGYSSTTLRSLLVKSETVCRTGDLDTFKIPKRQSGDSRGDNRSSGGSKRGWHQPSHQHQRRTSSSSPDSDRGNSKREKWRQPARPQHRQQQPYRYDGRRAIPSHSQLQHNRRRADEQHQSVERFFEKNDDDAPAAYRVDGGIRRSDKTTTSPAAKRARRRNSSSSSTTSSSMRTVVAAAKSGSSAATDSDDSKRRQKRTHVEKQFSPGSRKRGGVPTQRLPHGSGFSRAGTATGTVRGRDRESGAVVASSVRSKQLSSPKKIDEDLPLADPISSDELEMDDRQDALRPKENEVASSTMNKTSSNGGADCVTGSLSDSSSSSTTTTSAKSPPQSPSSPKTDSRPAGITLNDGAGIDDKPNHSESILLPSATDATQSATAGTSNSENPLVKENNRNSADEAPPPQQEQSASSQKEEKERKRQELLRQLKSVEEAIANAAKRRAARAAASTT